jgi:transposase
VIGMPTSFREYNPDQMLLLPPSLREWLPEGHLAYFVSDMVDRFDLSSFYAEYEGDGRRNQPFEPRMMVKVLLYGYATGTFSSRKLARKLHEDVAFRVLAAGNFPAHRTLCDFRLQHLAEFEALFVEVVRISKEAGLVKLGSLAIDGSKIRADASKHKAMSYGRMNEEEKRLKEQIHALVKRAQSVDEEEDARLGADNSGDEIPEELRRRETRLKKIEEAKQRLEQRQAEADREQGRHPDDGRKSSKGGKDFSRDFGVPPDKAQDNFTDHESRIMKGPDGFQQSYSAQAGVDADHQIIVAAEITQSAADSNELLPVIEAAQANTLLKPQEVLADAGYRSEKNFLDLEAREIDGYIAIGREGKDLLSRQPDGSLPATRRMQEKCATESGKKRYARRKAIVEPVFGWAKAILGFRQFSLRGVKKVQAEWRMLCLVLNLRRMRTVLAAA